MKTSSFGMLAVLAAAPLMAQETRELDAHEHGVSEVQIAVEGNAVDIMLHAPGVDVVGFEYKPTSDADKAAVAAAIDMLRQADRVIALDPAADCVLETTGAELHSAGDADSDHDHDHEEVEAGHREFEAHYHYVCASAASLNTISFTFFDSFPNAVEIIVEFVTDAGAGRAEVTRDEPSLTLQ